MATDTPNFNWPIPEDTDLVKDGAKAIRDLGNAIDTSAQDFGGGLVHIETRSISAVSAESFNDVFSATYNNYFFIFNLIQTQDQPIRMRLRVSGADNTSSNYGWARLLSSSATGSSNASTDTSWTISGGTTARKSNLSVNVFNPFLTDNTGFNCLGNTNNGSANFVVSSAGDLSVTTSYTGFTVFPASGNITGTITLFGYKI
jgi:hypothetical protein